jgi:hypothetical protein
MRMAGDVERNTRTKEKNMFFSATDLPYPGELRSSKGACPTSSHGEVSNSKESASGRMPDILLELGGWIWPVKSGE